ncbi:hypothetical protein LX32DRAFT_262742 [Colletotrichum zoysiae]|uniref:Hydrophobin n=1 Tax=Colletotrichum zoysiae TaxID=1216348 RepID=A0AAD9M794_9PEZI|nr:hypothetical protein LX32DRAFT_262742 [Colletotrichum zoysiae]
MRYSLIFFYLVPAIVSAQTDNERQIFAPKTGGVCCAGGTADPSGTCSGKGLNSFCCSSIASFTGNGCDRVTAFPVGRFVQAFPPTNNTCGGGGFIGCA